MTRINHHIERFQHYLDMYHLYQMRVEALSNKLDDNYTKEDMFRLENNPNMADKFLRLAADHATILRELIGGTD